MLIIRLRKKRVKRLYVKIIYVYQNFLFISFNFFKFVLFFLVSVSFNVVHILVELLRLKLGVYLLLPVSQRVSIYTLRLFSRISLSYLLATQDIFRKIYYLLFYIKKNTQRKRRYILVYFARIVRSHTFGRLFLCSFLNPLQCAKNNLCGDISDFFRTLLVHFFYFSSHTFDAMMFLRKNSIRFKHKNVLYDILLNI